MKIGKTGKKRQDKHPHRAPLTENFPTLLLSMIEKSNHFPYAKLMRRISLSGDGDNVQVPETYLAEIFLFILKRVFKPKLLALF